MEFFSQIGQDEYFIRHICKEQRQGKFLDVGAHDGVQTSNTYALERYLGWTGICIEANPVLAKECKQNRPNSRVVQAAVWSEEKEIHFELPGSGNDFLSRIGGLSLNANYFAQDFQKTNDIVMTAQTIESILGDGDHHFDYFSLDVEGAELEALKGINWNTTFFDYIAIEHGYRHEFMMEIIAFMESKKYKVHRINQFDVDFERVMA
jgi:FkbM family methyltransferase